MHAPEIAQPIGLNQFLFSICKSRRNIFLFFCEHKVRIIFSMCQIFEENFFRTTDDGPQTTTALNSKLLMYSQSLNATTNQGNYQSITEMHVRFLSKQRLFEKSGSGGPSSVVRGQEEVPQTLRNREPSQLHIVNVPVA